MPQDGRSYFTIGDPISVSQWRIDNQEELLAWIAENRYVRDLTCDERTTYNIEPLCELPAQ